jgi:hypothetical protein
MQGFRVWSGRQVGFRVCSGDPGDQRVGANPKQGDQYVGETPKPHLSTPKGSRFVEPHRCSATKSETYKPNCTITPWTQETFRAGAGLELTHRLSESYKHDATVQV